MCISSVIVYWALSSTKPRPTLNTVPECIMRTKMKNRSCSSAKVLVMLHVAAVSENIHFLQNSTSSNKNVTRSDNWQYERILFLKQINCPFTCICILDQDPQCIRIYSFHLHLILLGLPHITGKHGSKVVWHGWEDQSVRRQSVRRQSEWIDSCNGGMQNFDLGRWQRKDTAWKWWQHYHPVIMSKEKKHLKPHHTSVIQMRCY